MVLAKQRQPRPARRNQRDGRRRIDHESPVTCRLENGSYDKPCEEVQPNYPVVLRHEPANSPPTITPPNERSSGRRSELGRWLASAENRMTHRVWVNRIWQGHFGQGLVSNANDFGTVTPAPSHPELFDWLTRDFIDDGFQSKRLHRMIVSSATYRQGSDTRSHAGPAPEDLSQSNSAAPAYSYYPRQRLSSERIRDAWLMTSGQLNDAMYGPGTRPELPPNFTSYDWKAGEASQKVRRSIYIFAKRNLPYPLMSAFDFPDMHESCGCRTKTTIAPQALMLLNNQVIIEAARQLATRCRDEATSADPAERIRHAWQITFGRPASDHEVDAALKFVADQHQLIVNRESSYPEIPKTYSDPENEAFADLCHALLNANEFLFVE